MSIREYMTANVIYVGPTTSVREAFRIMKVKGLRHLPVVSDKGKLVGIVTDRDLRRPDIADIFKEWDQLYRLNDTIDVEDVMTVGVSTVNPETDLLTAASMLVEKKIGALPVIDETQKLVGIVTTIDILNAFVRNFSALELKNQKNAVLPS